MTLELRSCEPIASGAMRLVFRHPQRPDWLVKVIRPEIVEKQWGGGLSWLKKRRRFRQYAMFVREFEEYIATHAKQGACLPFMQRVIGLAETDYGLGIVLEAALGPDGELAPNVWRMIHRGLFDDEAKAALDEFFELLVASDVVVADLHPGNLVYSVREDGSRHFVMIDGPGAATLIPFKTLFSWLNRRSKLSRIRQLRKRIIERTPGLEASGRAQGFRSQ